MGASNSIHCNHHFDPTSIDSHFNNQPFQLHNTSINMRFSTVVVAALGAGAASAQDLNSLTSSIAGQITSGIPGGASSLLSSATSAIGSEVSQATSGAGSAASSIRSGASSIASGASSAASGAASGASS